MDSIIYPLILTILFVSMPNTEEGHLKRPQTTVPIGSSESDIRIVYEQPNSQCHNNGRVSECNTPLTNVAEHTPVIATSTCGEKSKSEEFCRQKFNKMGHTGMQCERCSDPSIHGADRLTDRHQRGNLTYWVSGPIETGGLVNLTISLGKTFEVYYISLQSYGEHLPDSIALYKSPDFGVTWKPWHYFSTDCYRAFRLPTSDQHTAQISLANIQEVLCVALKPVGLADEASNIIAFNTMFRRPANQPWSSGLINWMTMTDLRISLLRFPDHKNSIQHDANGLLLSPNFLQPTDIFRLGDMDRLHFHSTGTVDMTRIHYQSDASHMRAPNKKAIHFALSDLAIGGRCKCNGHANRCVRDKLATPINRNGQLKEWGPLRCDCQHNTAGSDCEHCSSGYLDRPWARATADAANECKPCNCNLHSNQCAFSQSIYLTSNKTVGSVCRHCQHNTAGHQCHLCASGYYRNWSLPIEHASGCFECRCHPIGSWANKLCDRESGQCQCKPGVTGRTCDRCLEGFTQSRFPDQPCIAVTARHAFRTRQNKSKTTAREAPHSVSHEKQTVVPSAPHECHQCKLTGRRINVVKFCQSSSVFKGLVLSTTLDRTKQFSQLKVHVERVWRHNQQNQYNLAYTTITLWMKTQQMFYQNSKNTDQVECICPHMDRNHPYLFVVNIKPVKRGNTLELILDQGSIIIPWRKQWDWRLAKFSRKAAKGRCERTNNVERRPSMMHNPSAAHAPSYFAMRPNQPQLKSSPTYNNIQKKPWILRKKPRNYVNQVGTASMQKAFYATTANDEPYRVNGRKGQNFYYYPSHHS